MEGLGKSMTRCVIVGAAPFVDAACLRADICAEDYIIAADGGQRLLAAMGIVPDVIIGDFDSSVQPCSGECHVLPTRKDDTDVMAAVRLAYEKGYRLFLLLGCMGGRFDHTVANLFILRWLHERGADATLLDERHEVRLLGAGEHTVSPRKNSYVSLLPYGGDAQGVTLRNAAYTLENACLDTAHPLGVSNAFTDKPLEISLKSGYLLLIIAQE